MHEIDLTIEHDRREDRFVVTADEPDSLRASTFLCVTLATIYDIDPADLPSLYPTIDLDALDGLLARRDSSMTVRFSYQNALITMLGPHRLHCQFVGESGAGAPGPDHTSYR